MTRTQDFSHKMRLLLEAISLIDLSVFVRSSLMYLMTDILGPGDSTSWESPKEADIV